MSHDSRSDRVRRGGALRDSRMLGLAVAALIGAVAIAMTLVLNSPRTQPSIGAAVGQQAPGFSLGTLDGADVSLASLRGTPSVVWFTAAYCLPCQEGARTLARILDDIGPDRVRVVMVFVDPTESDAEIAAWGDRYGRPEWTYARGDLAVIRAYEVTALDTKLLLDADGVVRAGDSLPLREDVWRPAIDTVLRG